MTTFDGDTSTGEAVDMQEVDVPQESGTPAEDVDPAAALKAELRSKPGDWYVIHSYAGYENKVKANLETRVQNLDVGDYIFQVEVPTEEVTEIKNGQRKQVNRKVLPGYILVRMDLTDDSWAAVRNTPGVTGFVGATSRPSALSLDDVVKFLLPPSAAKKAAKGAASTAAAAETGGPFGIARTPTTTRHRRSIFTAGIPRKRNDHPATGYPAAGWSRQPESPATAASGRTGRDGRAGRDQGRTGRTVRSAAPQDGRIRQLPEARGT